MPDENGKLTHKELEERWDREEGKLFKEEIIRQLQSNEHCVDWVNLKVTTKEGKEYHWKNFPGVMEIRNRWGEIKSEFIYSINGKIGRESAQWGDLRFITLRNRRLSKAFLLLGCLKSADRSGPSLKNANLTGVSLENANLSWARLEGADLRWAKMQGAVLKGAHIRLKTFWYRTEQIIKTGTKDIKKGKKYILLGIISILYGLICIPLGIILCNWSGFVKWIRRFSPTLVEGAEIKNVRLNSDPIMYRDLLDEQYLDRYAEKHKIIYTFWLLISNCGRSPRPIAIIALLTGFFFGAIYAGYPYPHWLPECLWLKELLISWKPEFIYNNEIAAYWWRPYYTSFTTLTTLGWASAEPANTPAFVFHTVENLVSYVLLGCIIAVLGDLLTRRSG